MHFRANHHDDLSRPEDPDRTLSAGRESRLLAMRLCSIDGAGGDRTSSRHKRRSVRRNTAVTANAVRPRRQRRPPLNEGIDMFVASISFPAGKLSDAYTSYAALQDQPPERTRRTLSPILDDIRNNWPAVTPRPTR